MSYDGSVCGHLVEEIKFTLVSNFFDFKCVFVPRVCNRVVHELAVLGYSCNEGEEVILDSLSESISVMVANDSLASE